MKQGQIQGESDSVWDTVAGSSILLLSSTQQGLTVNEQEGEEIWIFGKSIAQHSWGSES